MPGPTTDALGNTIVDTSPTGAKDTSSTPTTSDGSPASDGDPATTSESPTSERTSTTVPDDSGPVVPPSTEPPTTLPPTTLPPYDGPSVPAVAYQLDTLHSGAHDDPALSAQLAPRWSRQIAAGAKISYPLIVDGLVYVTVTNANASAFTYGTKLYALDATTGNDAWGPIDLGGIYSFSGIAYEGGAVFALNYAGVLQAFDAHTGDRRWAVQLPGQYSFTSPPTARGGYVYTGGAGSGGTVYAVDESNGAVAWTAGVMNGDSSSPAVDDDGVYVSYACNQTYRFAPSTGALLWHHTTGCEGGGGRTPVLAGGSLFVRDDAGGGAVVLDAASGQLTGAFTSFTAPAIVGDTGYFVSGGAVEAHALANQAVLWRVEAQVVSVPIVVGSRVFVGTATGTVLALDATTGDIVWSGAAGGYMEAPDEHNAWLLTGLGEGDGTLVVPAGDTLTLFA